MEKVLDLLGNIVGAAGVLVTLVAGISRLAGSYHLLGFESVTLFIGGIALMVMACLAKLHQLTVSS
jgi:hypothetical protein